jgi:hypothetical protein
MSLAFPFASHLTPNSMSSKEKTSSFVKCILLFEVLKISNKSIENKENLDQIKNKFQQKWLIEG